MVLLLLADNSEITIAELMTKIKGPDFPTGAYLLGRSGIVKSIYYMDVVQ